jgi:hypothetical protein
MSCVCSSELLHDAASNIDELDAADDDDDDDDDDGVPSLQLRLRAGERIEFAVNCDLVTLTVRVCVRVCGVCVRTVM